MTDSLLLFLIGLVTVIISALVYHVAIQDFCYSTIAENVSVLACDAVFAGSFLVFYGLMGLISAIADTFE